MSLYISPRRLQGTTRLVPWLCRAPAGLHVASRLAWVAHVAARRSQPPCLRDIYEFAVAVPVPLETHAAVPEKIAEIGIAWHFCVILLLSAARWAGLLPFYKVLLLLSAPSLCLSDIRHNSSHLFHAL